MMSGGDSAAGATVIAMNIAPAYAARFHPDQHIICPEAGFGDFLDVEISGVLKYEGLHGQKIIYNSSDVEAYNALFNKF